MNKKRITVIALLTAVLMLLCLTFFVACNNDGGGNGGSSEEVKPTEDLLISNGDFKVLGGATDSYPRSINDWSGAKMYSSASYPSDVIAGAIPLDRALYNEFRKNWNDDGSGKIDDPDGTKKTLFDKLYEKFSSEKDAVNNTLMIYMPENGTKLGDDDAEYGPTAYGYTSKSFTLEKGSYYKFTVDVLTYDIKGTLDENGEQEADSEPGARIYLSSSAYAEFDQIDTKGQWQRFEIYIENTAASSNTLTVQLGLGKYTQYYTKGKTTGYAFFDNVNLEKIDAAEDGTLPEQVYANAVEEEVGGSEFIRTATYSVPNGRFDFGSTNINSSSVPFNWTAVTGNSGENDAAPTALGYNGIINLDDFANNYSSYSSTYYLQQNGKTEALKPADNLSKLLEGPFAISALNGERFGKNVYMLSQQLMTAQGIKSSRTITFERNKYYALSIDIYAYNVHGAGVSLMLTGKDGNDIVIEGIAQNRGINKDPNKTGSITDNNPLYGGYDAPTKGWTTYTFYIQANQFKDYAYNVSLWLGTGGTSENEALNYTRYNSTSSTGSTAKTYNSTGTFSTGWVFFDELQLNAISDAEYNSANAGNFVLEDNKYTLDVSPNASIVSGKVSLATENEFKGSISDENGGFLTASTTPGGYDGKTDGTPKGWKYEFGEADDNSRPVIDPSFVNVGKVGIGNNANTNFEQFGTVDPMLPYDMAPKNALMLQSSKDSYFEVESDTFTVAANTFHRVSMWVKTQDIKDTSGVYVYLMKENDEGEYESAASFEKINTDEYDEYTNDWCELTFLIRGATEGEVNLKLKITLGTGTRWTSSTLAQGAAFVNAVSMTEITYANFTGTSTGTYVKSANFSTAYSNDFKNSSFDTFDLEKTGGLDDKGQLSQETGVPVNWSLGNVDPDKKDYVAGIIRMDDKNASDPANYPTPGLYYEPSQQIKNLFPDQWQLFNNLYGPENDSYLTNRGRIGGPNMLAIGAKNNTKHAIGYASDSFTLSASTYYRLSVWVKTLNAATASVYLSGESNGSAADNETNYFAFETAQASDWTEYVFYIEVGLSSVSLKLNLWLGYNDDVMTPQGLEQESGGIVLFDSIGFKSIDKETFDEVETGKENSRKISMMSDGFDPISGSVESRKELNSPSGWTGSEDTEQSSKNTKSGAIYAIGDDTFIETDESGRYVKILGKEIVKDEIEISTDKLQEAYDNRDTLYPDADFTGMSEEHIKGIILGFLQDEEYEKQIAESWLPIEELKARTGDYMLIINNIADSAYFYSGSNLTLKAESYYLITVWVRTYNVPDGKGAYVELHLGSANETGNPMIFKAVNTLKSEEGGITSNEWTQLSFYVSTLEDDVTSVKLKLGLGKYYGEEDTLTSGYAMFDDIEIKTVTEKEFEDAVEGDAVLKRTVSEKGTEGGGDEGGSSTTPKPTFNLDNLWWMIPTILLALATIAVVITFAVKRYRKPKKSAAVPEIEKTSETIEEKRDKYEDNKE